MSIIGNFLTLFCIATAHVNQSTLLMDIPEDVVARRILPNLNELELKHLGFTNRGLNKMVYPHLTEIIHTTYREVIEILDIGVEQFARDFPHFDGPSNRSSYAHGSVRGTFIDSDQSINHFMLIELRDMSGMRHTTKYLRIVLNNGNISNFSCEPFPFGNPPLHIFWAIDGKDEMPRILRAAYQGKVFQIDNVGYFVKITSRTWWLTASPMERVPALLGSVVHALMFLVAILLKKHVPWLFGHVLDIGQIVLVLNTVLYYHSFFNVNTSLIGRIGTLKLN